MLVSEFVKLQNLPASELAALSADVRAVKRRMIQEILPPGYVAMDDGSVVSADGKIIIHPEIVAAAVSAIPTLHEKLSFPDTIPRSDLPNADSTRK